MNAVSPAITTRSPCMFVTFASMAVMVLLIAASMSELGSASTVKVALAYGRLSPDPSPASYTETTCIPVVNPTPTKLKLMLPAELGMMPLVVLVKGENWLSIATKYVFAGSNPVPIPFTSVLDEFA